MAKVKRTILISMGSSAEGTEKIEWNPSVSLQPPCSVEPGSSVARRSRWTELGVIIRLIVFLLYDTTVLRVDEFLNSATTPRGSRNFYFRPPPLDRASLGCSTQVVGRVRLVRLVRDNVPVAGRDFSGPRLEADVLHHMVLQPLLRSLEQVMRFSDVVNDPLIG